MAVLFRVMIGLFSTRQFVWATLALAGTLAVWLWLKSKSLSKGEYSSAADRNELLLMSGILVAVLSLLLFLGYFLGSI